MNLQYQLQGIIIEQDASNFIRLFYSDGNNLKNFAATFTNGRPGIKNNTAVANGSPSGPMYLRAQRTGDTWTLNYSIDGITWTTVTYPHSLNVTEAGIIAGNEGDNPAHTAIVDYIFNSAAPIDPEDGSPSTRISDESLSTRLQADNEFSFELLQKSPNPAQVETTFSYSIPVRSKVILAVFDIKGNKVSEVTNGVLDSGIHKNIWSTGALPTGVYYYKLIITGIEFEKNYSNSKSLLIIR